MISLTFTPNLLRHVESPETRCTGSTVREVFDAYFQQNPAMRGYILDDQGAVRKHVAIFLNQELVCDRSGLSDPVGEDAEIYVAQALSGG
jgi:hypothetical protein